MIYYFLDFNIFSHHFQKRKKFEYIQNTSFTKFLINYHIKILFFFDKQILNAIEPIFIYFICIILIAIFEKKFSQSKSAYDSCQFRLQ